MYELFKIYIYLLFVIIIIQTYYWKLTYSFVIDNKLINQLWNDSRVLTWLEVTRDSTSLTRDSIRVSAPQDSGLSPRDSRFDSGVDRSDSTTVLDPNH